MKVVVRILIIFFLLGLGIGGIGWVLFGPAGGSGQTEVFTIPQNTSRLEIPKLLYDQKYIRHAGAFEYLLNSVAFGKVIASGGYELSKNSNAWEVLNKITQKPDLAWVTISSCQRKEQIGERLAKALEWSDKELNEWNNLYSDTQSDYYEGVYYPDTYLIPVKESVSQVAQRFIDRFNEKLLPLSNQFIEKNIKWTTGLKIASLIARETDVTSDLKIVSGIIWNRLNIGMLLQIDSTMQYTRGKDDQGNWWSGIDLSERLSESPYNTYLHKGLPPTPICSPDIEVIEAALNPAETECFYYLHDSSKQIHCAATYEEHLENIQKYLQ